MLRTNAGGKSAWMQQLLRSTAKRLAISASGHTLHLDSLYPVEMNTLDLDLYIIYIYI